jgi:hypothetical protein
MKKAVAAPVPGPSTVAIIAGAKIIVRVGAIRWANIGTIRAAAPIRRTDLTKTISAYSNSS